jgi:hypothetical protein
MCSINLRSFKLEVQRHYEDEKEGRTGGGSSGLEKCKGRSREPLAEVSLERPVARHFVCQCISTQRATP